MTDTISNADKLKCAERELTMRSRIYPGWVAGGKMSAGKAAHEIACMKAIVGDYVTLVAMENLP